MSRLSKKKLAEALLERHGKTFTEELSIRVESNTPAVLFQTLCASLLFSARIGSEAAKSAFVALKHEGWTTPGKMARSSWEHRAQVLNEAGYARYDNRTASQLGDAAEMVKNRYKGDLRNLREQAERDPAVEHRLLKQFKGIGDTGADIFLREVQTVWDENAPYVGSRGVAVAQRLGLDTSVTSLKHLVDKKDYSRFADALIRTKLADDYEEVMESARNH